jgi:hypothetical protein
VRAFLGRHHPFAALYQVLFTCNCTSNIVMLSGVVAAGFDTLVPLSAWQLVRIALAGWFFLFLIAVIRNNGIAVRRARGPGILRWWLLSRAYLVRCVALLILARSASFSAGSRGWVVQALTLQSIWRRFYLAYVGFDFR